jgi:hypothetical protein
MWDLLSARKTTVAVRERGVSTPRGANDDG